jgi:hypothetical protein
MKELIYCTWDWLAAFRLRTGSSFAFFKGGSAPLISSLKRYKKLKDIIRSRLRIRMDPHYLGKLVWDPH